jgi:acyl-CoA synthetase (AMP-forming)/AMP-acid ligase II
VGGFGYPIADATLAIVNPETNVICPPDVVGEIWVDSPSLSGGFWALPKHTANIFHARPFIVTDNPLTDAVMHHGRAQEIFDQEFLRTGFLGCVVDGNVFVLGLYEDRLRQRVEWIEEGEEFGVEYRYHYTSLLIGTILQKVPKVFDCAAFDVFVNEEHLPIILLESPAASTAPLTPSGPPRLLDHRLLHRISEKCIDALLDDHQVRVYCVLICAPNTLPRSVKSGRREIGNMLCRKQFELGSLPFVHVKFAVERTVLNLPVGQDPVGGIWSLEAARDRWEWLGIEEKQYSGLDQRDVVVDERTSAAVTDFKSIVDVMQYRAVRQPDELAYTTIDPRGREGKGLTWKKLDLRIAATAHYIQARTTIKTGASAILMYTHSEDFILAVHACLCLGVIAIPMQILDPNRLSEDVPALLQVIRDYGVKGILVNTDTEHALKGKAISNHLKQSAQAAKIVLPSIFNTSKPSKTNKSCKESGYVIKPAYLTPSWPAIVWTYWTPDQRRVAVELGHDTIMAMCKVQKETCQMGSSRPVVGCVRSSSGLGFIHTCLMGGYIGNPFTPLIQGPQRISSRQWILQQVQGYCCK